MTKESIFSQEDRKLINDQGRAINFAKSNCLVEKLMYQPVINHLRNNLVIPGSIQLFSDDNVGFVDKQGLEVSIERAFPPVGISTAAFPQTYDFAYKDLKKPLIDLPGLIDYMDWAIKRGVITSLENLDANSFFLTVFSPSVFGHNRTLFPFASKYPHSLFLDHCSIWNYSVTPYIIKR